MGYCIMKISKIKSFTGQGGMGDRYRHNMRLYEVNNADYTREKLNRELIDIANRDYEQAFYKNIEDYKQIGIETKIRKNAILAFEIMMTFSKSETDIDIDRWCEANLNWLDDTFNKEMYDTEGNTVKQQNVVSAMLHMDETTPHIHAIVIPRDDEGKLNGSIYVENATKMRQLQSKYAEYMSDLGLERGLERSVSRHKNIKEFYASLDKVFADELPKPIQNESIEQYRNRANQEYQGFRLKAHASELSLQRQIEEEQTKNIQRQDDAKFLSRLEKEVNHDDCEDDIYTTIYGDVKDMELLKRCIRDNQNDKKLKEAFDLCKGAIEQQRQMELMRDAILFTKEHNEYDPYEG